MTPTPPKPPEPQPNRVYRLDYLWNGRAHSEVVPYLGGDRWGKPDFWRVITPKQIVRWEEVLPTKPSTSAIEETSS